MIPNMLFIALAALIPMIVGFVYYNPKTMGTAWMNASGMTEEKMKGASMGKIFGFSLLLSFMLSIFLMSVVIHQSAIYSLYAGETGFGVEGSAVMNRIDQHMLELGDRFRTFGHGALHGTIAGLFFALPVLGINALFERKSFKYILINVGYWVITLALMGGVICQWA